MNRCWFCGSKNPLTRDHLVPRSRGGNKVCYGTVNLVQACQPCNNRKGDMTLNEYRHVVREHVGSTLPVVFYGEQVECTRGEYTSAVGLTLPTSIAPWYGEMRTYRRRR